MSRRLGKGHRHYVGNEGIVRLKRDKCIRKPTVRLFDMYIVQILLTETSLRDKYRSPQDDYRENFVKRLKPSKIKLYEKLGRYYDRSHTGK